METDQSELKPRKTDVKANETETETENENENKNESDSGNGQTSDKANSTTATAVIQTKEEYFNALREWLQQVQLQQMAYTYFPYYLYSSLQSNPNNVFIPSMPFLPTQYPTFPAAATSAAFNQPAAAAAFAGNGNQANPAEPLLNRPPIFANNLFQPNRNNYVDNIRQNMQILYQNGGFEYVIAPIWKRFLAEAIDVSAINVTLKFHFISI